MSRSDKGFTQCLAPPLCKPTAPPHFRQETMDNQSIALLECNLKSTYQWTCYTEYLKNHDRFKNANDQRSLISIQRAKYTRVNETHARSHEIRRTCDATGI